MTLAGCAAATHNNPLDEAWADAIARFPEERDEIDFQMNSARAMAKAFAKRGP